LSPTDYSIGIVHRFPPTSPNAEAPVVHLVDDDASFRTAIARLLGVCGYEVVPHASATEFLQAPPRAARGCILLDVRMPGLSGPQLQQRLAELGSVLPIVFLSGHGDIPTSVKAIKAGAEDFLPKPVSKKTLLDAIERALARYDERREQHERLSALLALVNKLSPREKEVFALVVRGSLNKQIAFELGTSERTIKAHRHSIMDKLAVRSLAEAVTIAERLRLIGAK
jgi:FixJ family two-component response regulator